MTRAVVLSVNGERVEVHASGERLIDVIRNRTRFKSVKLGCGEGGCGACAVSVTTWDTATDKAGPVRTINACLAPVGSLDGCAITTSEGLGNSKAGYHAVQEQIAKHHGSQCGFCTPGIVVACHGVLERAKASGCKASVEDFQAGLDGNLCRCTGWRPIMDACRALADLEDLCSSGSDDTSHSPPPCSGKGCSSPCSNAGPCAAHASDSGSCSSLSAKPLRVVQQGRQAHKQQQQQQQTQHNTTFPTWLRDYVCQQAQQEQCSPTLTMQQPSSNSGLYMQQQQCQVPFQQQQQQVWLQPRSLDDLWSARQRHPAARLIAGNTGAGIFKDAWPHDAVVIDVRQVSELRVLERGQEGVTFGGAVTLSELLEELRGSHVPDGSREGWRRVAEHVERIAGHHVRSSATLGGHFALCRSRPLQSDLATLFMALGAKLQLSAPDGCTSWVGLEEFLQGGFGARPVDAGSRETVRAAAGSNATAPVAAEAQAGSQSGASAAGRAAPGSAAKSPKATPAAAEPVIVAVLLPYLSAAEHFWSSKVALRYYNCHALVNAALWLQFDSAGWRPHGGAGAAAGPAAAAGAAATCPGSVAGGHNVPAGGTNGAAGGGSGGIPVVAAAAGARIVQARLVIGHPSDPTSKQETWACGRAAGAEAALAGQHLDVITLLAVLEALGQDLGVAGVPAGSYHARALEGLVFQGLVPLVGVEGVGSNARLERLLQGCGGEGVPPVVQASQSWQDVDDLSPPVYLPVEKDAVRLQASGEAVFTSDIGVGATRQLYAAVVKSSQALADVAHIDPSPALTLPGVVSFVSAADIPAHGTNATFGSPLFAEHEVCYVGQPIGLVVATSIAIAERAAALVNVEYRPKPGQAAVLSIQQAVDANSFYADPALAQLCSRQVGDTDAAMSAAKHVIKGARYDLPAQQHFYMEPQVAVAVPGEDGEVTVHSATQSLDGVQGAVAGVLGLPVHKVIVVTKRVGGAFGGKASRSLPVAAAAAVAATKLGAAVHHSLSRDDDFRLNGGRCCGEVTYDVGFEDDGTITACDIKVILRAGAFLDLAFNDAAQFVHASDSAYAFPNMRVAAKLARCNLPPHTIMRGPGYIQGVMVSEQILEHVAAVLGLDSATVKQRNFIKAPAGSPEAAQPLPPVPRANPAADVQHPTPTTSSSSSGGSSYNKLNVTRRPCAGSPAAALAARTSQITHQFPSRGSKHAATAGTSLSAAPPSAAGHAGQAAVSGLKPQMKPVGQRQGQGRRMHTALGHSFEADAYTLPRVWEQLRNGCEYDRRMKSVSEFNKHNAWQKRGIAMTPVRFDCNPQPVSAAVSIYADGSICVSHGGIEMGQGLSTKVKQAAAFQLSLLLPTGMGPLPLSIVRLAPSSTDVVPGGGPTWSSTGSEGCVQAVRLACNKVAARLAPYMQAEEGGALASWKAAVARVHTDPGFAPSSVMLSAYGYFDGTKSDGTTVSYSAFGAACSEVEINLLTGERNVLRTDILYDCGRSLNPAIDIGQVEGAFVQGVGMWVCEEVVVDEDTGALLTDSSWSYKIPTPDIIPRQLNVSFLEDSPNPRGIMGSKASGEPALMTSTSVLSALQQATAAVTCEVAQAVTAAREVAGALTAAREVVGALTAAREVAGACTAAREVAGACTAAREVAGACTAATRAAGAPAAAASWATTSDTATSAPKASLWGSNAAMLSDFSNMNAPQDGVREHHGSGFRALCAPATPVRLLAAVGNFSIAAMLRAALEDGGHRHTVLCQVPDSMKDARSLAHGEVAAGDESSAADRRRGDESAGQGGGGSYVLCAVDTAGIAGVVLADDDWELV